MLLLLLLVIIFLLAELYLDFVTRVFLQTREIIAGSLDLGNSITWVINFTQVMFFMSKKHYPSYVFYQVMLLPRSKEPARAINDILWHIQDQQPGHEPTTLNISQLRVNIYSQFSVLNHAKAEMFSFFLQTLNKICQTLRHAAMYTINKKMYYRLGCCTLRQ